MDPNAILGRFLRHVEAFRQSGDTDDAAQAAECHTYLSEWLQKGGFEPTWSKFGFTREKFDNFVIDTQFATWV